MTMTDDEIMLLYAKDQVVSLHKFAVANFDSRTWGIAVASVLASTPDSKIMYIRGLYGDFD